jgi:F420-dependent oxidoreductase-like protein
VRIGLEVDQHRLEWAELLRRVRYAEDHGFDGVWLFDHFKALYGQGPGPCFEGWTALAALAAATTRVRLGLLVTGVTYRHPSVLAAEAVTVDHVSGGRLELGLGAAWFEQEHLELGIPFPPTGERMDRLEEAVEVLRLLMTTDGASFDGRYYQLRHATYRPRPVQSPHPPLWIGGSGERRTLPLAGRTADAWHTFASPGAEYRRKWQVVAEHAERAGRNPAAILRAANLSLSEPWDEVRAAAEARMADGVGYLICSWPSEGWERLEEFVESVLPDPPFSSK